MDIARAKLIHGWMSEGELCFLAEHASKSKLILEAGSYRGRSTRAMADNTKGIVHAIDPWDGKYENINHPRDDAQASYRRGETIRQDFYANLFDHIVNGTVLSHQKNFHDIYIPDADMIFIDANHSYGTTRRDILHGIGLLPSGGILLGHDYCNDWPDVGRAVDGIFGHGIDVFETIWWIKL